MIREDDSGVILEILAVPRASRVKIGPVHDGRLKIAITAPPVDGEANAAIARVLARALGCARSAISIVAGQTGRRKTVRIAGVSAAAIEELLQ